MVVVDVDIRVSSKPFKRSWTVDKRLRVISTIVLFNNSNRTKELKNKTVLNLSIRCYVALSDVF